jgi:peptidoglycan/LPS O-acetylase OafA/YrhL
MSRQTMSRFAALDALRGIAAILVVLQHSSEYIVKNPVVASHGSALYEFIKPFDPGRVGVICFFLISGFIIPSSFGKGGGQPLSEFAAKRIFRLFPAYWLSMIMAIITDAWLLGKQHDVIQVAANATMIQNILGQEHIQGLYWTLQVELLFYFMCAGLFKIKALGMPRKILATLLLTFGVFAVVNALAAKFHLTTKFNKELFYAPYLLGVMLCGTLFRIWFDDKNLLNKLCAATGFGVIFSVPILNMLLSMKGVVLIADPQRFFISHLMGLALFLAAIIFWRSPPAILLKMGLISYSIYLFHPIVMHCVSGLSYGGWAFNVLPPMLWLQVLATLALTCALSALTYLFVEAPCNEFAKNLCKRAFYSRA